MKTLVDTCIWSSVLRRDRIANKDIEKKFQMNAEKMEFRAGTSTF
mgnify:CR=1 FL=1